MQMLTTRIVVSTETLCLSHAKIVPTTILLSDSEIYIWSMREELHFKNDVSVIIYANFYFYFSSAEKYDRK